MIFNIHLQNYFFYVCKSDIKVRIKQSRKKLWQWDKKQ